jgi:hypothetical protein
MYGTHVVVRFGTVFLTDGCALDAFKKSVKRSRTSKSHRARKDVQIVTEVLLTPAVTVAACSRIRVCARSAFGARAKFKNQIIRRRFQNAFVVMNRLCRKLLHRKIGKAISAPLIPAGHGNQFGLEFR